MTEWELEAPPSWDVTIPTDDTSIARRRRALAPIQVLADLERTKGSLQGEFWDQYDLFNIALGVIDQVALSMGISAGRTWDEVLSYAAEQARRQCPDATGAELTQVAQRVLVSLVTTDVETVPYLLQTPTGPVWKAQRFRLLFAHPSGPDATEHLRASEHAINVFVNALDLDIEAAQIANEAQMRVLIERGAVESAAQLAQVAQYQSAQYLERTRRIVADTLLDPDAHDWINAVPKMLNDALSHVADRLTAEAEITKALTEQRTGAVEMDVLNRTNELIERLRDCRHRHNELHQHLIEARARHRAAVNDRLTRPPRATHRIDIGTDLLAPYLRSSTAITAAAAERMVAAVGGINVAWMPSLTVAIADLCSPPRESAGGEEYDEPDFEMADESDWWEPYEDAVEALLGEITTPVRLTQLLARADDVAESLVDADGDPLYPSLLAAAVVHAAHRLWTPLLAGRDAGDALLVALDDGRRIDTDAVSAADLLVVPAEIIGDIDDAQVAAPVQLNPQPSDELLEETAS